MEGSDLTQNPAIKVLIVDDHQLMRFGLKRILSDAKGITVVGEAESGEDVLNLLSKNTIEVPDVVLMDVKMPGIGGLETTRRLLHFYPQLKILAVSACQEEPFPSRLIKAGALGYLTKGCSLEEIVNAIHKVHSGQVYLGSELAQSMALKKLHPEVDAPFDQLSERELQVMLMITSGQTVQDISDKLCLSTKTVNSYRYRLFEKLNVSNDVELTHLAIRHGLMNKDLFKEDK